MQEFKKPKPNLIVTSVSKAILPFWLRFKEQLSIKISGRPNDLIAFSKRRRALVLLNHPDRQDPFVIVELARRMGEQFYCIAARECFDWDGGSRGWLFQSLGCYSVARGRPDFHSIATTEKILREGRHKLVIFPEAEITGDERVLHELHKPIFHIVLDIEKKLSEKNSLPANEHLAIIPAAIKYSLQGGLAKAVEPSLLNIEKSLALSAGKNVDAVTRVNAVVDAYLGRVFDSYGLDRPEESLEKSAETAAIKILEKITASMHIAGNEELSPMERLYALRGQAAENIQADSVALKPNVFHCAGIPKPCIGSDFERVERLLILQRLLLHTGSEIPYCRMLDFIESELTGGITPKGWQTCLVSVGAPIEVSSFLNQYNESKDRGVDALSEYFRQKLQDMIVAI